MTTYRTVDFAGIEIDFTVDQDVFGDTIWKYRHITISRRAEREYMVADTTGGPYRVEKSFRAAAAAALEMVSGS